MDLGKNEKKNTIGKPSRSKGARDMAARISVGSKDPEIWLLEYHRSHIKIEIF